MTQRVLSKPTAPRLLQQAPRSGLGRLAAVAGILALSALVNYRLARQAERRNPPRGRFLQIEGVRLHYVEAGKGPALVLLHGNGSMVEDFISSGLVTQAARDHRVIVFDRPGYGHSTRPRDRIWDAEAQADLIRAALIRIGVTEAIVLGHSWGTSVAVALGLKHPQVVRSLVLVSGYYYPTSRLDMLLLAAPAVPGPGTILRHAVTPVASRLLWPALMRKIFGPRPVPAKFDSFPREMALRPSQLRALALESALLIPVATAASACYPQLQMPVVIVAGTKDRLIDPALQSGRLHAALPHSTYHPIEGGGHMVHQTDTAAILHAIAEASEAAALRRSG